MKSPILRLRKTSIASLLAPALMLLSGLTSTSFAATIVVPNSVASSDGNISNGFPFDDPMRYQQVFAASEFSAFARPQFITQIAFRPEFCTWSFESTLPHVQINLSTTPKAPDGLDATYANNVGGDDTIVFSGPLTASSAATCSWPEDFDIVINLQTPFFYDPSLGNLLLDIRNFEPNPLEIFSWNLDADYSDTISRLYGPVNNLTGLFDSLGLVTQFTTSGATTGQGGANVNLTYSEQEIWLCTEPVRLEYWVRTVEHDQSDATGGSRSIWQVSFHGTGVGLSTENQWQWHGSTSFKSIENAAGGKAETMITRIHAPLLGQRGSYHLWIDVHFTVTPDGDWITDWYIEEPWCQGLD
ncbi:MAG: hypothetical protein OEO71_01800 [Gammaproteobacteria bacterium]|nr:hypothetical protein [Gammaproteobacteria bacterium]